MKAKPFLITSCFLSLALAVGFTSSEQEKAQKLAEQEFKNIKVFKGMPANEVRPAMEAFSSALGVGCDFCHVLGPTGQGEFEKDDKDMKRVAREMFVMMNKINKDNFEGRMEVTCAACHQGHQEPNRLAPIGQPPAVPPTAPPNDASLPSAESLIDKYVAAIGGSSADGVKTLTMKGKVNTAFGTLDFENYAKAPNKWTKVVTFPNGVYTEAHDGVHAWSHFGTETAELEGAELVRYSSSSPIATIHLKETYSGFRRVRKETLNGKDVFVVGAQTKTDGLQTRLYFDATTGMLLRKWTAMQTVAGAVPMFEDYSDYRDIAGVKIPWTVALTNSNGVWTFVTSELKVNEDIPESRFAKPVG